MPDALALQAPHLRAQQSRRQCACCCASQHSAARISPFAGPPGVATTRFASWSRNALAVVAILELRHGHQGDVVVACQPILEGLGQPGFAFRLQDGVCKKVARGLDARVGCALTNAASSRVNPVKSSRLCRAQAADAASLSARTSANRTSAPNSVPHRPLMPASLASSYSFMRASS